ncbi:hypothetical protein J7K93_14235 [bacterium]|nr:hypothetical protein [bacterium]
MKIPNKNIPSPSAEKNNISGANRMMPNKKMKNMDFKQAFISSGKNLFYAIPMIAGILFLFGFIQVFLPSDAMAKLFSGNIITDALVSAVTGSIITGNPINSYIIGGELLKQNVSFFAVTIFITAWVTVGVVQLPAEIDFLGKKFAILRNLTSLVLAIAVSALIVITWKIL